MNAPTLGSWWVRRFSILGVLVACSLAPRDASARDLQGRLGLGYNAQFANSFVSGRVPGISLKYAATRDIAFEAVVGTSTASPSNSVTGFKLFKNIFMETNLNFYFMAGGAIVSAANHSGTEFLGGFGTEFFIPGLESLGLAFEAGGSLHNLSGNSFSFRTFGVSFIDAGIHFYF